MLALLLFGVPASVFWIYFAGLFIFTTGIVVALRQDGRTEHGLDRIVRFGPPLFAAPLAVFGSEHFLFTKNLANMVPSWLPGHLFWVYFVGVALLAAAFSIVTRQFAGLASTLLGVLMILFVVLIFVPGLARHPPDRFGITVILRETTFGSAAFALACSYATPRWLGLTHRFATVVRYVFAIVLLFYASQHFLHPGFVPVVPLELRLPGWLPLHWLWSYGVGAALLTGGLMILVNWKARRAAICLGLVAAATVVFVYLPILLTNPADIPTGVNYVADTLMMSGAFLLLATSLPETRQTAIHSRRQPEPYARPITAADSLREAP